MTPDEVLALAEHGRQAGCKEALFSLGDQPERIFPEARQFLSKQGFTRTLDYVAAMGSQREGADGLASNLGSWAQIGAATLDRPRKALRD